MDKKIRCLLVDDFDAIRSSLKTCLMAIGIDLIDEAVNGEKGMLKLIESTRFAEYDLIFCDWNMPVMSGIEMLRTCKGDKRFSHIPFIMVTSESDKTAIIEAVKLGAADYVVKPFTNETVTRKIKKVLGL